MKIKVIAAAPYDGWAFIVKEEKTFLLRPPYISSNLSEVSDDVAAKAVSVYGFEECDAAFDSMSEVIRFLKDQLVKLRKDLGFEVPSSEELRELLKYFDDDVLFKYLRRAQTELIPEGNYEAAESIALEIMKLERVETDPEMRRMAVEILERCKQERKKLEALEREIANNVEERRYGNPKMALKHYHILLEEVGEKEQILGEILDICIDGKLFDDAMKFIEKYPDIIEGSVSLRVKEAKVLYEVDKIGKVKLDEVLGEALKGGSIDELVDIGRIYYELGKEEEFRDKIIEKHPESEHIIYILDIEYR